MNRQVFDVEKFYYRLNECREKRELQWKEVGKQVGICNDTFCRLKAGNRIDIDTLALLLAWSGLEMKEFIPGYRRPDNMALVLTYLKDDLPSGLLASMEIIIRGAYKLVKENQWPKY